jgi:hypothetical protein
LICPVSAFLACTSVFSAPFLPICDPWIFLLQHKILRYGAISTNQSMAPPTTSVLNGTSTIPPIAPQPEDASPSPAAHLLHNSQDNNPVPVASAEAVVEPSDRPLPTLTTVSGRRDFDVGDAIEGILDETGGHGHSADADAFSNALATIGPDVEAREGVESAIEIAAGAG